MRLTLTIGLVAALAPLAPPQCDPPRPPTSPIALGAITADGTAVYIPAGGTPIELLDDGPSTARLHSVDVTPDGERAWVTECCEPVWGQWWEVDVGVGPVDPFPRPGYAFDLDATEGEIASLGYFAVAIRDLAGEFIVSVDLERRDPWDVAWIDHDRIAVIELVSTDEGVEFRLVTTDDRLTGYATATGVLIGRGIDAPWPRLAGVDGGGRILVQRSDTTRPSDLLEAYDPLTLERVPAADVRLAGRATSAWMADGHVVWIDRRQRVHVDGVRLPGRYTWARPTG